MVFSATQRHQSPRRERAVALASATATQVTASLYVGLAPILGDPF
jgi:hypothetical protein